MLVLGVAAAAGGAGPASAAAKSAKGQVRQIARVGTTQFSSRSSSGSSAAGVQNPELPAPFGADAAGVAGPDRSNTRHRGAPLGTSVPTTSITDTTPGLVTSFSGIDHFDQRFGTTSGSNQFSIEPPDQGLCVGSDGNGNTRVLETVNDVVRVFTTTGAAVTPAVALNHFLDYAPAIVRTTNPITFGPFVTDPSCLYDAATGRWFLDVLTIDTFPHPGSDGLQHFTGTNHIDIAVSDTSDPTGSWTIYRIPVQDDGTDGTPDHHCTANTDTATPLPTNPNACLGDYPHIGSDANGVYITTNEYSLFGINFIGAQVYAFSKAALESGGTSVAVTQFNTHGLDTFGFALNGFTLWPSTTPGGGGDPTAGGTEYFLSSNAAAEAHDTGDGSSTASPSTQLLVWALTNTSSLDGTPDLSLSNTELDVGQYAPPPRAAQEPGNEPLRQCLNNATCSVALEGVKDPFNEKSARLDSNDTRMQQVTWVNGQLWGALDTALSIAGTRVAGIEWFDAAPSTASGPVTATLTNSGYLGVADENVTYPAIGVTSGGTGVMGFTLVGPDYFPSAGYATLSGAGVSDVHIAAAGAGPADGFSDYKLFGNPPGTTRPRWGDYGAAVPVGGNVWLASEFIDQTCNLATYKKTNFRCGNTRTALANWSTRISEVAAP